MASTDILNNLEAEKSVIGGILLDNGALGKCTEIGPEDFSDMRHALVWRAIISLSERNVPQDLVTLTTSLHHAGHFDDAGGSGYLTALVDYVPTAANITHYVRMVKDCSDRRRLAAVGREIVSIATHSETSQDALDAAESRLLGLRNGLSERPGAQPVMSALAPALRHLEGLNGCGGGFTGLPTGFPDLDSLTAGLQPDDLIIIAGRPSMGKTALGLNVAENVAAEEKRVLFFSIEMSMAQVVNRLLSRHAKVDSQRIRTGTLLKSEWAKVLDAAERIHSMPLLIDNHHFPTTCDIRSAARRVKTEGGLSLIVIDYLQLIKPTKSLVTREREVAEISRSLKALAKELHVPVVVLAQLNRAVEANATYRRPIPSDLRESGSLEQDADVIIFPWREAAYCEACRLKQADCGKGHYRSAELIVSKQRNGPVGTVRVAWLPEYTTFVPIPSAATI